MLRYSRLVIAFAAALFASSGGCSKGGGEDSPSSETLSTAQLQLVGSGIKADITVWPAGNTYSAGIVVTNTGTTPTTNWEVDVQLNNSSLAGAPSNATATQSGNIVTLRPLASSANFVLPPGAATYPGINGVWSSSPYVNPAIVAVRRDVSSSGTGGSSTGGASTGGTINSGGAAGSAGFGSSVATTGGTGGTSGNNVAQDKPATGSTSLSGNPASYGNDASSTTSWCAASSGANEWWSVDLGAEYALTGTEVTWPYSGRVYQYVVSLSSDGTNYVEVVNQRGNTRITQTQADGFTAQGRYLKLQVTGLTSSPVTSACIADFKAFGTFVSSSGAGGTTGTGTGTNSGGTTSTGSLGGTTSSSGGVTSTGGTTWATSTAGATSGGATSSGGTSSTTGGTTSVPTDRRRFTIRLPGGVRRQDAAVAVDGGPLNIADRTQVVHDDGTYSSVTGMAMPDGSRIGVEARVLNAWVDGNIALANRTVVDSYAKATGNIAREADTHITDAQVFQQYRFTPPEVINWDVDFPLSPTESASLGIAEVRNVIPGGYDVGYAPRDARLRLTTGTYTFNRVTIEDGGIIEVNNSAGPVFVYIRDFFAFRGTINRTAAKANVLFGVAGTSAVSVERAFKGILVAPSAPVTLTATVEHRGAFFGKGVTVLQDVRLVHEPFDPSNFCTAGGACTDFCPCGGDTCGESSCSGGKECGKNKGRKFGRGSGVSVCVDPGCTTGAAECGGRTATCGVCGNGMATCESDADCPSGDVCGTGNGARFGLTSTLSVCWSAACQLAPNAPPNCGGYSAACGSCDCHDACTSKNCGDASSDGCGGTCTGLCGNGQAGCNQDSDCPSGSACGFHIGGRFGLDPDANVCWPSACRVQDPTLPNGGVDPLLCGVGGACQPACEAGYSGPDGCGGYCGQCESGDVRTSFGYCTPVVTDVWQPVWDTSGSIDTSSLTGSGIAASIHTPDATPALSPSDVTSPVGAVAGSFAVSDRGEATYTIPVAVPPGRLRMQPSLSLSYRSNKVNGMMGLGWAVGGLSTITRCPWTVARDGKVRPVMFDAQDRFCLDGQALLKVEDRGDGATYRLEGDATTTVIATDRTSPDGSYTGPWKFEVRSKDGRIRFYGGDVGNAMVKFNQNIGRVWALRTIKDRSGNTVLFSYRPQNAVGFVWKYPESSTGSVSATAELLPDVIAYGGYATTTQNLSPSRFVRFVYENRDDDVLHYMWGVAGFSQSRLTAIETKIGDRTLRRYVIRYTYEGPGGNSQVAGVTECGIDAITCKPETTFQYEIGGGWGPIQEVSGGQLRVASGLDTGYTTVVLDYNGDGRDDVFRFMSRHPNDTTPAMKSISCYLAISKFTGDTSGFQWLAAGWESPLCRLLCTPRDGVAAQAFDVDHDGRDDLVTADPTKSNGWLRNTGNSAAFDLAFEAPDYLERSSVELLDLDGNGFKDVVVGARSALLNDGVNLVSDPTWKYPTLSPPTYVGDSDGDGAEEYSNGALFSMDANGDGLPDAVMEGFTDRLGFDVAFNPGRWLGGGVARFPSLYDTSSSFYHPIVVDSDGDNLQELASPLGSSFWDRKTHLFRFDPSRTVPFPGNFPGYDAITFSGDFDGDGTQDLISFQEKAYYALGQNTAKAGFLREITDGLGKRTTIKYDRYHTVFNSGPPPYTVKMPVYYAEGCAAQPRKTSKCLKNLGPVVSSHSEEQVTPIGVNAGAKYDYTYYGARQGVGGRDWFALRKLVVNGPLTSTQTEYYTDDNHTASLFGDEGHLVYGKAKTTTTKTILNQPASAYVPAVESQETAQFDDYILDAKRSFSYLSSRDLTVYENGQRISNVVWRANTVDEFGFAKVEETKEFGVSQTSHTTIVRGVTNDTLNWRIGQVDSETATSTVWTKRGTETRTRQMTFGYDSLGRLDTVTREPDGWVDQDVDGANSNPYLRTEFTLDKFGNVETIFQYETRGYEKSRRIFHVSKWDPQHFWPTEIEDALGKRTSIATAAATGQLLRSTDPNGATSTYRYDDYGRKTFADTPTGIASTQYGSATLTMELLPVWGALSVTTTGQGEGATTTTVDAFGRVVRKTTPGVDNSLVDQEFEFDSRGRLVREARPHKYALLSGSNHDESQGFVNYGYYGTRKAWASLPDGNTIRYYYPNSASHTSLVTDWFSSLDATYATVVVNPRGNISATVTNPAGAPLLRVTGNWPPPPPGSIDTGTGIVEYTYGSFGVPRTVSNPGVSEIGIVSDVLGRPIEVSDPATGTVTKVFNAFGEQIRQTDGNGTTTSNHYDALGRLRETLDSTGAITAEWTYDGLNPNEQNRLVRSYRASAAQPGTGIWQTYHYQPEPYGPSSRGMLQSVTYGVGGTPLTPGSGESFAFSYEYADAGVAWRPTALVYPSAAGEGFSVGLRYSGSGALTKVTSSDGATNYWELLETDQGIRPALERFGNGVESQYDYYRLSASTPECSGGAGVSCMPGLPKSVNVYAASSATSPHLAHTYVYDGNGNLSVKTVHATVDSPEVAHHYAYDGQDRLIQDRTIETTPTDPVISQDNFTYDAAGNLRSKTGVGDYHYDPANATRVKSAGSLEYGWDVGGNLLSRSGFAGPASVQGFIYDDFNLPYRITSTGTGGSSTQTELEYDANGARVVKRTLDDVTGTTRLARVALDIGELYQQVREYDSTDGSTVVAKEHHYRIFGGAKQVVEIVKTEDATGRIDETEATYLHQDHLGSGVLATGGDGAVRYRQEYDAFGAKKAGNWDYDTANVGFTGHQHDEELGLVNMRGRLYDARLGRFMKADPFVTEPRSLAGLNRFSYVKNNPLRLVDPSGFTPNCSAHSDGFNGTVHYCTPDTSDIAAGYSQMMSALIGEAEGREKSQAELDKVRAEHGEDAARYVAMSLKAQSEAQARTESAARTQREAQQQAAAATKEHESEKGRMSQPALSQRGDKEGSLALGRLTVPLGLTAAQILEQAGASSALTPGLALGTGIAFAAGLATRGDSASDDDQSESMSLYHGAVKNYSSLLAVGFDPSRPPVWVSPLREGAASAIGPNRVLSPGEGGDMGIIHSEVPRVAFEALQSTGGISPVRNFSFGWGSHYPEYVLRSPEAIMLFNAGIVR